MTSWISALVASIFGAGQGGGADFSGYGETWGPGIGPPPPGCGGGGGGAGAQLEDIENASRTVLSPYATN